MKNKVKPQENIKVKAVKHKVTIDEEINQMEKQINTNNDHNYKSVASITPSGFFGTGNENIVELTSSHIVSFIIDELTK